MVTDFADIPTRDNGEAIDASWFNALRDAGAAIEGGFTQIAIANNQAAPLAISGLIFDPTVYRSFSLDFDVCRITTGAGATAIGERSRLYGIFLGGAWQTAIEGALSGTSGVTLSLDSTGQVYYTSTNISGTASISKLNYVQTTMGV